MNQEISVYMFHNKTTGQAYVGSTKDTRSRYRGHLASLRRGQHSNANFQEAYSKNTDFDFVSVPFDTREEAFEFEQIILDEFVGEPGFLNISTNAFTSVTPGRTHAVSDEAREKMRQAKLGTIRPPEVGWKISRANKGRRMTPEQIERKRTVHARHGTPVIADGKWFETRGAAARYYGISVTTVTARIRSGVYKNG